MNTEAKSDYGKPISDKDILILRSIGQKSVNDFTTEDIKKSEKWAYKFYKELGTKSPFFRAWFGDWRAKEINHTNITIVKSTDEIKTSKQVIPYFKKI